MNKQEIWVEGEEIFLFCTGFSLTLGPIQELHPVATVALSPGHEIDHKTPSGAEFRNVWVCTTTTYQFFMVFCLIEHSQLYLYLSQTRCEYVDSI